MLSLQMFHGDGQGRQQLSQQIVYRSIGLTFLSPFILYYLLSNSQVLKKLLVRSIPLFPQRKTEYSILQL